MIRKMNIGLDFDHCFTEDPDLWLEFIDMSQRMGHKVYIVTMRNEIFEGDYVHEQIDNKCDIIFTSRNAKRNHVKENHGVEIDIWIDDNPHYVGIDHPTLQDMNESVEVHERWTRRNNVSMKNG